MRIVLPFVILVALLGASLAWDRPQPRADLTTGYISIETLDPQVTRASEDVRMAYALFEGLYTFDNDFNVVPGVAESHELSSDGLTYTFRIRENARWSDGTPLTADVFARSWLLGMLPDTTPPYIEFYHFIKGGRAFTDWGAASLTEVQKIEDPVERRRAAAARVEAMPAKFAEIVGVRTPDVRTIVVQVERPTPFFLEIAATWPLFPLPLHVIEPRMVVHPSTSMLRRDQQWVKPDNHPRTMVSNGPYTLESWTFKRSIRLAANPHYWDRSPDMPQTVELKSFTTAESMFNSYQAGELDLILGGTGVKYAPELVEAMVGGERNDVHRFSAFGVYYYEFNCRPEFRGKPNRFTDPRVRRAFAMAIDKTALTTNVTRLRQQTTGAFVPPGSIAGYTTPPGLPYDVERARAELATAGYGPDKPFGDVFVVVNTGGNHRDVALAMFKMWQRAFDGFGVTFSMYEQEFKVVLEKKTLGDFEIARSGWFGDYMDPTTFLDLLKTGNGSNTGAFSDAKYDALLAEAADTLDPAKRLGILMEAERYVMADASPVIPLYYYAMFDLYDPDRVSGVSNHPRNLQLFHRMRVKPR